MLAEQQQNRKSTLISTLEFGIECDIWEDNEPWRSAGIFLETVTRLSLPDCVSSHLQRLDWQPLK